MDLSVFSKRPSRKVKLKLERVVALFRAGVHRSRIRGLGTEFWGLRPYDPSDALVQIDWLASARLSEDDAELVSRVYHPEQSLSVLCLVDAGKSMRYPRRKQEAAAFALRLFALSAFKCTDRFAAVFFGAEAMYASSWVGSEDALEAFLSDFGSERSARKHMLPRGTVAKYLLECGLRDTLIVVISDFGPAWTEEDLRFFKLLESHHKNVGGVCIALDEWHGFAPQSFDATFGNPLSGRKDVFDLRSGGEIALERREQESRFTRLAQVLRPLRIPFVRVPIVEDFERTLQSALQRAGFC